MLFVNLFPNMTAGMPIFSPRLKEIRVLIVAPTMSTLSISLNKCRFFISFILDLLFVNGITLFPSLVASRM